jgi:S1-C subfamily serine protease
MLDPFFANWLNVPPMQGFLVETVEPGSPAEKIGLRGGVLPLTIGAETLLVGGDIITKVDGTDITDIATVRRVINGLQVGQKVHIDYFRTDQGPLSADVVLPERPELPTDFEFGRDSD